MPVLYTICTCNPKTIGDWPAKNLLEFLRHLTDGDMLLRMKGGTPAFVDSLIKGIDIHSGSAIKKVELQGEKVLVENEKGDQGTFDRVIVATPSKLEEFLNPEQFAEDMNLLKQFRFEQGDLVIHTDATVMPPRRKDWSVLSYMMDRKFTRQQFTVWMNAVEPSLVGKNPVFQTWRPVVDIDPKKSFQK